MNICIPYAKGSIFTGVKIVVFRAFDFPLSKIDIAFNNWLTLFAKKIYF